jgi:hypothetical protein
MTKVQGLCQAFSGIERGESESLTQRRPEKTGTPYRSGIDSGNYKMSMNEDSLLEGLRKSQFQSKRHMFGLTKPDLANEH